jgi:hypothetical protein
MSMSELSKSSRLVATDLRKAEKTIEEAQRDLLRFMLTATEANIVCGLSPAMSQPVIRPAIAALAALAESQQHLSGDAHGAASTIARHLKLTVTDYGASDPKPSSSEVFTGASARPANVVEAVAI